MSHFGLSIDQNDVAGVSPIGKNVNDIHFVNGVLQTVVDGAAVAQSVRQHLETYLGEWFLDSTVGVGWFQYIYVEPFDIVTAEAVIKAAVMEVDGVSAIIDFAIEANTLERHLIVSRMSVTTIYNENVRIF